MKKRRFVRKPTIISALILGVVLLIPTTKAGSVATGDSTAVRVRVETPDETIFSGTVSFTACEIEDTTGISHSIGEGMALCALDQAARQGGFEYQLINGAWGLYLQAVSDTSATETNFWMYRVNYQSAFVGLADCDLQEGDSLLIALSPWPDTPLRVESSKGSYLVGEQVVINTFAFDDSGGNFTPEGEVEVFIGEQSFVSDPAGQLEFELAEGSHQAFGQKQGFVRSEKIEVVVEEELDDGTTPGGGDGQDSPPAESDDSCDTINQSQVDNAVFKAIVSLEAVQKGNGEIESSGVSDWAQQAFASFGTNPHAVAKDQSLADYVAETTAFLDSDLATDWERKALAALAIGADPYKYQGYDLVGKIKGFYDGTQIGKPEFVNDDIFGILVLLAAGEDTNSEIVTKTLENILAFQQADGSFIDVDTTAAAIQALQYASKLGFSLSLQDSIDRALDYIKSTQQVDGGFPYLSGNTSNASTTAWVILALNALGVDPLQLTASSSCTPAHYLLSQQEDDGSFRWMEEYGGSAFITVYAVPALKGHFWPIKAHFLPPDSSTGQEGDSSKEQSGDTSTSNDQLEDGSNSDGGVQSNTGDNDSRADGIFKSDQVVAESTNDNGGDGQFGANRQTGSAKVLGERVEKAHGSSEVNLFAALGCSFGGSIIFLLKFLGKII